MLRGAGKVITFSHDSAINESIAQRTLSRARFCRVGVGLRKHS